jgi:hypothetical protein
MRFIFRFFFLVQRPFFICWVKDCVRMIQFNFGVGRSCLDDVTQLLDMNDHVRTSQF